ncbi:MAG: HNH endonuclease [Leptolyngbya foveolarum]|uniref:HNH endonuclease n=1 Tax=Leptolyngbya foveolarum TaxID=47253 RepID=A0A2W4U485_9CYAN|nr:MAG: HNH endonuclease [Leptolyngbya foveolarum]
MSSLCSKRGQSAGHSRRSLNGLVLERASLACEYCLLPDSLSFYPHEVDHVIALKHRGQTSAENLAYACWRCNRFKGSDLGSFDPQTGDFSFLFNPREQFWSEHFTPSQGKITGRSQEGRTTAFLLKFNTEDRIQERLRF